MFSSDDASISANAGERHMRVKRPLVLLSKDVKECGAQRHQFFGRETVRPQ
jgi:hypothetical protein